MTETDITRLDYGGKIKTDAARMAEGMAEVKNLQRRYMEEYLARMKWIGVDKTLENLDQDLAAYLGQQEQTPA